VSLIDGICQRYGQRPSDIIGITDKKTAFDFDGAVAIRASEMEKEELEKMKTESSDKSKAKKIIPDPKPIEGKALEHLRNQFNAVRGMQNIASKG